MCFIALRTADYCRHQIIDTGMDPDMLRFVLIVAFAGVAAIGLAFARWR